jgi:hypothetical protein
MSGLSEDRLNSPQIKITLSNRTKLNQDSINQFQVTEQSNHDPNNSFMLHQIKEDEVVQEISDSLYSGKIVNHEVKEIQKPFSRYTNKPKL